MRIRSTKPEFWRSETIALLDWDTRLVLKGLESYVDDNGVGKDSVVLICADVFPHDLANDPETIARVSRALASLADANLVVCYKINGHRLIYVRRWKFIQRVDRPNKGRFPRPDGTLEYDEDVDESVTCGNIPQAKRIRETIASPREDVANTPATLATGTVEQGSRGTVCGDTPDSPFCPEHPHGTKLRCGDCANARTAFNANKASREQAEADELEERRQQREAERLNCPDCHGTSQIEIDDAGTVRKCEHRQVSNA